MLDGKETLSNEQQEAAWQKEVPTLESAFPCGTVFKTLAAKRDLVSFIDSQGTEHVLGKTEENQNPLQSFFITSLDPNGSEVVREGKATHIYNHILLFSAVSKSFKIGIENAERTTEVQDALKAAAKSALDEGKIDAAAFAAKMKEANTHKEYDVKYRRNFFTQMFWDILVDWNAEKHPEMQGYAQCSGRTFAAQRDRLAAFIGENQLISLREVEEGKFVDNLVRDEIYSGFVTLDFYNAVSTGRLLTCFARECDWKKWQEEHKA